VTVKTATIILSLDHISPNRTLNLRRADTWLLAGIREPRIMPLIGSFLLNRPPSSHERVSNLKAYAFAAFV